jgi:hypothetical protein
MTAGRLPALDALIPRAHLELINENAMWSPRLPVHECRLFHLQGGLLLLLWLRLNPTTSTTTGPELIEQPTEPENVSEKVPVTELGKEAGASYEELCRLMKTNRWTSKLKREEAAVALHQGIMTPGTRKKLVRPVAMLDVSNHATAMHCQRVIRMTAKVKVIWQVIC